jgi:hypothetical protein
MKSIRNILLGSLLLAGLQFGLGGCVSDGYVSTGVYYGPRPWFHEGPWIEGRGGYYERDHYRGGGDVYISPPRPPGLPAPPRLRLP